jgi:phage-related protein
MIDTPVHWVGSSKKDLLAFPEQAVSDIGYALGVAQLGGKHPDAKPWKGQGPGVLEIVEAFDQDAYRLVYAVRFAEAIYVLHAFQKKSPKGIATDKRDVELVAQRLKMAQVLHVAATKRKD